MKISKKIIALLTVLALFCAVIPMASAVNAEPGDEVTLTFDLGKGYGASGSITLSDPNGIVKSVSAEAYFGGKVLSSGVKVTASKGISVWIEDGDENGAKEANASIKIYVTLNENVSGTATFTSSLNRTLDPFEGSFEAISDSRSIHIHSWSDWTQTKAPSCGEDGEETRTCSCGAKETRPVAAIGEHTWGEWTQTKAPTHTEDGVESRSCSVCGETETNPIPATGHTYGDWQSNANGHWKECSCGDKTSQGEHTYVNGECIVCGYPEPACEHAWDEGVQTKAPTCVDAGVMTYTCSKCGESYTEDIPALGHKLTHVDGKAATCTENGNVEHWVCETCGKYFADEDGKNELSSVVISKTGHDWEWKHNKDQHWKECANCGETTTKADHEWEWVTDKKPTATTAGEKHQECECGAKQKEGTKIPATGEDLDDVPRTGDITPYITFTVAAVISMAAGAAYVFKRKFAK